MTPPPPSGDQVEYIIRLAGQLTGERVRYLSQSSVVSPPKTKTEASVLIDDLLAAIAAEEERRARSLVVEGARITFGYDRKDGGHVQVTGTVARYKWAGLAVVGVYLGDVDEQTAAWKVAGTWLNLRRMSDVRAAGDDPAALRAERELLLARLAEVDRLLETPEDTAALEALAGITWPDVGPAGGSSEEEGAGVICDALAAAGWYDAVERQMKYRNMVDSYGQAEADEMRQAGGL